MKKTIITIFALLIALIVVAYGYEFIFKKPVIESPTVQEETFPAEVVELKEQHKDSSYTFAGMLDLPTPCHTFTTKTNKISESKYQIQIDTISPKEDVMCAQVITPKSYKVTFDASNEIEVTVLINGVEYETNRFQIPNDQNIDSFILEVKG